MPQHRLPGTWKQVLEDPNWVSSPALWRASPLWLDDIQIGWIVPHVGQALKACSTMQHDPDGWRLQAPVHDREAVSKALQAAHDTLAQANLLYPRQGEWLDVLNETALPGLDNPDPHTPDHAVLGFAPRSLMRPLGLLTQAVRWTLDNHPETVMLGRRSPNKRVAPNAWDNRAAGLVSQGESPRLAMSREALEEAGHTVHPSHWQWETSFYTCRQDTFGVLRERTHVWVLAESCPICHNQDGEVTAFETVSWAEVWARYQAGLMMPEAMRALAYSAVKRDLQAASS